MDPFKPHEGLAGSLSTSEVRRWYAETLYFVETEFRRNGIADKRLVYDEEHDLYRFSYDGTFAFSRKHANWKELKRRGMLDG